MRTHRFGRKLKLPSTIAIKHQLRQMMAQDALKTSEAEALVIDHPEQIGIVNADSEALRTGFRHKPDSILMIADSR
jgi:hypothetical protein